MTDSIEIRRNVKLATGIGVVAFLLALGFALRGGGAIVPAVLLFLVAAAQLWSAWDGRTPLAVIDERGARLRLGSFWLGLPWTDVDEVEHLPRYADQWWRDGRLALLVHDEESVVDGLPRFARFLANASDRLYGVPFALPLGLSTRVRGAEGDLTDVLVDLVRDDATVVEIGVDGDDLAPVDTEFVDDFGTSSRPEPTVPVRVSTPSSLSNPDWRAAEPVEPTVVVPVVGLRLSVARSKMGYSVEQLSLLTRISPAVLRAMESDDFSACGGDFYARGNLRTLARVLGIDPAPLLREYEVRFAETPLDLRTAFSSDLQVQRDGLGRRILGGPVLVGAGLLAVTVWAVAQSIAGSHHATQPPAASFVSHVTSVHQHGHPRHHHGRGSAAGRP